MTDPRSTSSSPALEDTRAQALADKSVVVTRAPHQAAELEERLRANGAVPIAYPCIAIAPPDDPAPLHDSIRELINEQFDWLVLTSANVVVSLAECADALGVELGDLSDTRIAAIGPGTARAIECMTGRAVDLLPTEYVAESLADALEQVHEEKMLVPQADIARPVLVDRLRKAGKQVTDPVAYQTVCGQSGADVPGLLHAKQIDAVTFTSSSTVENFIERLAAQGIQPDALRGVCLAYIGPIAAAAGRKLGLAVDVLPDEHTLDGLVDGLANYFITRSEGRQGP